MSTKRSNQLSYTPQKCLEKSTGAVNVNVALRWVSALIFSGNGMDGLSVEGNAVQ